MDAEPSKAIFNLNVGILGHVDSGKTSLAKALSDVAGTAAFDKHPQSQERGITIDLGFSALQVDIPEHLREHAGKTFDKLQFTLVDCPGHASLIRTIIGGAHIIHMMILVIDVTKGMQTQTAECLVIGEIMSKKMVVVLNKIDLLPSEKRSIFIQKMVKKINLTLAGTSFQDVLMVAMSANPSQEGCKHEGLDKLVNALKSMAFIPSRIDEPFVFMVDHCFNMPGHGTVMTGTVLQGAIATKEVIEVPSLCLRAKVKSMQMFRRPLQKAEQGDRLGMCIAHMESKQFERGLICTPGYLTPIWAALLSAHRVKYFKGRIKSKSKFHVSICHETVMATIIIFKSHSSPSDSISFDFCMEYEYQEELQDNSLYQYMLLKFEKPVLPLPHSLAIGSHLGMDLNGRACRLAFWGNILRGISEKNYEDSVAPQVKVYKLKTRRGLIDRIVRDDSVIVKNLIKKETNTEAFIGMKVMLSSGESGRIESTFGKSGKLNILIPGGLKMETMLKYQNIGGKKTLHTEDSIEVILTFKRYIFDAQKKMTQ